MKSLILFVLTIICTISISSGCKKDSSENTAPNAYSGDDQIISLPEDSIVLKGVAFDMQNNITRTIWKKLTGPSVYSFQDSTTLITAVNSLQAGKYMFQLTVIDKMGLADYDTTFVTVIDPAVVGTRELVFEDIQWICVPGCSATVKNIYDYTQGNFITGVLFRIKDSDPWERLEGWGEGTNKYYYDLENNILGVYTAEASGSVDIKVNY